MEKEYTTFRERVNLEKGLDRASLVGFVSACTFYEKSYEPCRDVLVSNLSEDQKYIANGSSIMDLMCLTACQDSELEVKVEGTDEAAISFSEDLRKGLNEEFYLIKKFLPLYRKLTETRR